MLGYLDVIAKLSVKVHDSDDEEDEIVMKEHGAIYSSAEKRYDEDKNSSYED